MPTIEDVLVAGSRDATTKQLMVVDTSLPDYQQLVAAWGANHSLDQFWDVLFIDPTVNGVESISQYLSQAAVQYDAIHLVSHGFAGGLQLGNALLTAGNLEAYASQFEGWRSGLTAEA
ncbi:MAG: DUF4347 domain-containing protein, partial [Pirellulaceae bacterium]